MARTGEQSPRSPALAKSHSEQGRNCFKAVLSQRAGKGEELLSPSSDQPPSQWSKLKQNSEAYELDSLAETELPVQREILSQK